MATDFLLNALATLFVTIDPLGLAPIFLAVTQGQTGPQRRNTGIRAVIIAAIVLAAFALVGERLLGVLGISLPAFRIAGGLMLFWIGFEMTFEKREARKSESANRAVQEPQVHDVAAVPLAVPLMAGPGAITAVILLAGSRNGDAWILPAVLIMIAIVLASCLIIFLLADQVDRLLGNTGRTVLTRLLGVILAALAVQYVADGVGALVRINPATG